MARILLVRYGREEDALEVGPEESAHAVVAARFGLRPDRVTLVCRGKKYDGVLPRTATAHLLAESARGHVTLVVGTQAVNRLFPPRLRALTPRAGPPPRRPRGSRVAGARSRTRRPRRRWGPPPRALPARLATAPRGGHADGLQSRRRLRRLPLPVVRRHLCQTTAAAAQRVAPL